MNLRTNAFTLLVILSLCSVVRAELAWEKTELDLHPAIGDATAVGIFKYENKGKTPIHFNGVHTSCGCTVAALKKNDVAPGEKGEITAIDGTVRRFEEICEGKGDHLPEDAFMYVGVIGQAGELGVVVPGVLGELERPGNMGVERQEVQPDQLRLHLNVILPGNQQRTQHSYQNTCQQKPAKPLPQSSIGDENYLSRIC